MLRRGRGGAVCGRKQPYEGAPSPQIARARPKVCGGSLCGYRLAAVQQYCADGHAGTGGASRAWSRSASGARQGRGRTARASGLGAGDATGGD